MLVSQLQLEQVQLGFFYFLYNLEARQMNGQIARETSRQMSFTLKMVFLQMVYPQIRLTISQNNIPTKSSDQTNNSHILMNVSANYLDI